MKTLINIAINNDGSVEQKIHSMNILKALYRHNQLGELVTPYVAKGVIIAITGFSSRIWSIRNSATLLFSALMTRMFGVQRDKVKISSKNKLTAHVFFMRYPELYEFLFDQLKEGSSKANFPSLYGILLIFGRLYPSKRDEDSKYKLNKYLPFVEICLSNVVYQTRDLAAAASISMIPSQDVTSYLLNTLEKIENSREENYRHGLLLQLHYLLKTVPNQTTLDKFVLPPLILNGIGKNVSHLSGALYIEVLVVFLKKFNVDVKHPLLKMFFTRMYYLILQQEQDEIQNKRSISTALKKYILARMFIKILCGIYVSDDVISAIKFMQKLLFISLLHGDDMVKQFSLNVINYLRMDTDVLRKPNLYVTEELEKSQLENKLIEFLPQDFKNEFDKRTDPFLELYLCKIFGQLRQIHSNEFIACYFIALAGHVKVLNTIFDSPNQVLSALINLCDIRDDEKIISAVITVISSYVQNLEEDVRKKMQYQHLFLFLEKCVSPRLLRAVRLSVCDFFIANEQLFFTSQCILSGRDLIKAWCIIFTLTEDDDTLIHHRISNLVAEPFEYNESNIPLPKSNLKTLECSKKQILRKATQVVPEPYVLQLLLLLIFRGAIVDNSDEKYQSSDVFDRGSINIHAEESLLALRAQEHLKRILWDNTNDILLSERNAFNEGCSKLLSAFSEVNIAGEIKTAACELLSKLLTVSEENKDQSVESITISSLRDFLMYIFGEYFTR